VEGHGPSRHSKGTEPTLGSWRASRGSQQPFSEGARPVFQSDRHSVSQAGRQEGSQTSSRRHSARTTAPCGRPWSCLIFQQYFLILPGQWDRHSANQSVSQAGRQEVSKQVREGGFGGIPEGLLRLVEGHGPSRHSKGASSSSSSLLSLHVLVRSLILKLSDTRVYEPQIRARLGTTGRELLGGFPQGLLRLVEGHGPS